MRKFNSLLKKAFVTATAGLCLLGMFGNTPAAEAAKYGDQPLTDAINAASSNLGTSGLKANQLAAMMVAVTWPEVIDNNAPTGYREYVPSPMTVGRADVSTANGTMLWADGVVSSTYKYARAHWSAGIGVYQLDGAGMGANVSLHQAVMTNTASGVVAAEISRLYTNATGTAVEKRRAAWKPWYGCGTNKINCENNYIATYSPTYDTLNITRDTTVTRTGGLQTKTCYTASAPTSTWTCYRWDASLAQGHKGSWQYTPTGSSSLQPLPLPFYTYYKYDSAVGKNVEYRHWLKAETGYDNSKWGARVFGLNPRSGVNWYSNSSLLVQ
jgi:hypothetical protein